MHISFLMLLVLMPQEQLEAELRRQEQQIVRLEREVRELERRNSALEEELQRPICSARVSSTSATSDASVSGGTDTIVQLSFFSTVSQPERECLPAEIQVAASYVDASGGLICSGVIRDVARQSAPTQNINLHIRPWNTREFARWANEPPTTNSGAQMLFCYRPDGQTEASPTELAAVGSLHLHTTVFPKRGGVSTEEFVIRLQR
jgi:hypothetical protein